MASWQGGALEGIRHAHAVQAVLCTAVDDFGRWHARCFQQCRHDIIDMMELVTNVLGLIDMSRPCHDKPVTRSAQMGRSEERRVGKECVSTCRSRWSP